MVADRRKFAIRQGLRIRHPDDVLNRYDAVYVSPHQAESVYGSNLLEEDERVVVPKKAHDFSLVGTNQLGLIQTAKKNVESHEKKLENMFVAGI